MTSTFWLAHRKRIIAATIDMVAERDPYALLTIGFKQRSYSGMSRERAAELLQEKVKPVALACDELYHGTRYVTQTVPREQRFEAICFSEKRISYPHSHIAFFGVQCPEERLRRRLFLLENLPTTDATLSSEDEDLLRFFGRSRPTGGRIHLLKRFAPDASGHVVSVHNAAGLGEYLCKELASRDPAPFETFYFLSEFHSKKDRSPAVV